MSAISVIIPTYKRSEKLLHTLSVISECDPAPAEVLVHIDGDDQESGPLLERDFPTVRVLHSPERIGPGGARTRLAQAARFPLLAGFDDDSFPLDNDYFARATALAALYPEAGVIAARIFHPNTPLEAADETAFWVSSYTGCGCVYRRVPFLSSRGHVERVVPYGIEENDLSLRLLSEGWRVLESNSLRVYHDTNLSHHSEPSLVAGTISNVALLAFLRYPPAYWFYGFLQTMNIVVWMIRHGRINGVLQGIGQILPTFWKHRRERQPLSRGVVRSYLRSRRHPLPASVTASGSGARL